MKKATKIKETDTEFLARQIADGFGDMNKRFSDVDKRFDFVDVRLEEMNGDITSVQKGLLEVNHRLDSIEKKQAGMMASLDEAVHQSEFKKLVRRVEALEVKPLTFRT